MILICISLMIIDAEHLYPLAICTFFWGGKMSIQALFPVFNCVGFFFFFDAELYECFVYFGYLSLSDVLFANIFSHLVGCLCVLLSFPSPSSAF